MNCHAGCAPEFVASALGLSLKDLFHDDAPKHAGGRNGSRTIKATYDYTDAQGGLLYQVVRYEPKTFAQRRPDGNGGWHWNLQGVGRVLYNLPAVLAAINAQPQKKIFLVEGEKDVETLRNLGITATTNAGGAAKWQTSYSQVLNQATVIILPDNDEPGRQHARVVAAQLEDCVILELPGLPPKGDVTDWVNAGGTRRDLVDLTRAALNNRSAEPAPAATAPASKPALFKPLGYDGGHYFFLPSGTMQVTRLSAPGLGMKPNLFTLAPLGFWEMQPDYMQAEGKGPNWQLITSDLIQQCQRKGVFRPEFCRGRGAWLDDGRTVLHLGDRLIVDGQPVGLMEINSGYIYEQAKPLEIPHKGALSSDQAGKFADLCQMLSWETPVAGQLLAGWVALAPICGALKWRPHVWITGGSGTGKSWTMNNIIKGILGGISVHRASTTTEAGLRQDLKTDALPVEFDEFEGKGEKAKHNIQRVLELARQASSEGGAKIAKGTATGEAQIFDIRSMFCMCSIKISLEQRADETRVTVLALRKPPSGKAGTEAFAKIEARAAEVCTKDFAAGLIARSCGMARIIRRNAETFSVAVAQTIASRRTGDQLGTLLAGYWSLWNDDEITLDKAIEYVRSLPLKEVLPSEENQDENRCLAYLIEQRVKFDGEGPARERTIAELIQFSTNPVTKNEVELNHSAEDALRRYGLRCSNDGLIVSTSHSGLAELLKDTEWSTGWSVYLRRIDGVTAMDRNVRFAGGHPTKCVLVPWDVLFTEDEEPGAEVQTELEDVPF